LIHFAKIAPIFIDACKTVEMKTIFDKAKMMQFCYNTEKSMTRINDEIQLLKKYENVIYTNLGPSVQTTRDLRVP
jgi:hypothetical protein